MKIRSSSHLLRHTSTVCGLVGSFLTKEVRRAASASVRRQPTLAEALLGKGKPDVIV